MAQPGPAAGGVTAAAVLAAGSRGARAAGWNPGPPPPAPSQLQFPGEGHADAHVTHISGGQHNGVRGKWADSQATMAESCVEKLRGPGTEMGLQWGGGAGIAK